MSPKIPPPLNPADPATLVAIPDHSQQPRDPARELFGVVPQNIGKILSADSTLKRGAEGWSTGARLFLTLFIAGVEIGLICWALPHVGPGTKITVCIVGAFVALFTLPIAWGLKRLNAETEYVGTEGIYHAKLLGTRSTPLQESTLRFADAAELHTSQTRHTHNGVYSHTTFAYTWNDASGKKLFVISGQHNTDRSLPKPGHPYHFARAAEIVWSDYALPVAEQQLVQQGSIAFRIDAARVVRVGRGFMEFQFGGEPHRLTRDNMGSVSLADGQFFFKHKDAKWYSRDGKYNFQYSSMPNARLFLLALEKLMGYRWQ